MKDKILRKLLYGECAFGKSLRGRVTTLDIPAKDEKDIRRVIKYPSDDGLVVYFIKKLEGIEKRLAKLEEKRK